MFRPDGTATAAWMLPFSTVMLGKDGEPLFPRQLGEAPDPFANDMDLALYIAMASGLLGDFGGEPADSTERLDPVGTATVNLNKNFR